MKKTILIILVLAAVVGGCDKRESRYNKIYGYYQLSQFNVDGVDSLSLYKDSLGIDYDFHFDEIHNNGVCKISGERTDGKDSILVGHWGLSSNNDFIEMFFLFGPIGVGPIGNSKTLSWEIIKLRNSYMKLKTTYNNKEYEIELE